MTITAARTTTDVDALVADLDRAVRTTRGHDRETVAAVEEALRPAVAVADLLRPEQRVGDPASYRTHLLHVAPDGSFSLVALVWLPGHATPIHDHLAWCVVGVHDGVEHEVRYRFTPSDRLVETGRADAHPGAVAGLLPPGDIHRVQNVGRTTAVSLHVHGADLGRAGGRSIRRTYDPRLVEVPLL